MIVRTLAIAFAFSLSAATGAVAQMQESPEQQSPQQQQGQQGQQGQEQFGQQEAAQPEGAQLMVSPQQVRQIQEKLNSEGYNAGPVDGIWGGQTQEALRNYQKAKGLEPTGNANTSTLQQLGISVGGEGQEQQPEQGQPLQDQQLQDQQLQDQQQQDQQQLQQPQMEQQPQQDPAL